MATPTDEQIASAWERATAHVHAKLDALEEQRLKRTGWRNQVELWTLPHGDLEPVASLPGWVEVGWIVCHGEPEHWDVLMERGTGRVKVRHVRKCAPVPRLTSLIPRAPSPAASRAGEA
jgi:hypothetical protein